VLTTCARARSRARLAAWSLIVVVAAAVLHASGNGALAAPPITRPSSWSQWLGDRTPVETAFAFARLGAIAATWQLAVTTAVGALARVSGAPRLTAVVDRVTAAPLRVLLSGAFGIGVMTSSFAGTAAFAAGTRPPTVETMVRLDRPPTETMVRDRGGPTTWLVAPGDSFWAIAHRVEMMADGREPSTAEIAEYWEALMAANRGSYRDADLIHPGQVFDVPAPPVD
jgi:nucleoid-associated protein YgaU